MKPGDTIIFQGGLATIVEDRYAGGMVGFVFRKSFSQRGKGMFVGGRLWPQAVVYCRQILLEII